MTRKYTCSNCKWSQLEQMKHEFQSVVQATLTVDLSRASGVGGAEDLGTIGQTVVLAHPNSMGVILTGNILQQP